VSEYCFQHLQLEKKSGHFFDYYKRLRDFSEKCSAVDIYQNKFKTKQSVKNIAKMAEPPSAKRQKLLSEGTSSDNDDVNESDHEDQPGSSIPSTSSALHGSSSSSSSSK
jgi:hypothetical protein